MTDLLAVVLKIKPLAPILVRPLPRWWGRAAQALFLQTITALEPALAEMLHSDQAPPPFTVSTLLGFSGRGGLSAEKEYALRFTALSAPLAALLQAAIEAGGTLAPGSEIEFDHLPFTVQSACNAAEQHPQAGSDMYTALAGAHLLAGGTSPRRFHFRLFSPAFFKSHGGQMPLPLPGMLFGSLMEKWNAFAPLAFPAELRRYADECLAISRFRLSAHNIEIKEGVKRTGGLGEFSYTTLNYDRYWLGMLDTLAHFAFFAGVGAATGLGLGQCWLQPEPEKPALQTD